MSTQEPGRPAPGLTALPRLEELRTRPDGSYDPDGVREAFEAFRRHTAQLQAQLRVLQAAGRSAHVEPTGHSVRMDALHLIRAAAEFADTLERDAQNAASTQLARTEEEVSSRQHDLQARESEVERYRNESERQRAEILNAAKAEARELLANAHRDASQELREAEVRGNRLLEQSRHQATELTNAARAEVEQTLEWARAQAGVVLQRAQHGAEQLLRAAGLGEPALSEISQAILRAAEATTGGPLGAATPARPAPVQEPAPLAGPAPFEGPEDEEAVPEPEPVAPEETSRTESPADEAPSAPPPAPPLSGPPSVPTPPPPPFAVPPTSPAPPPPTAPSGAPPTADAHEDEDEGEPGERA